MKSPSLRVYAIAYLIFLYAPIILLPMFALNDSKVVQFPLKGFTFEWFREMTQDAQLGIAVKNSLIIAFSSATLSTVLGIFAARASTRFSFPAKGSIMGLIMLPMVLPEIVVAMSLLIVLLSMGVKLSLLTIIMGHVLVCTPFAVAILSSAFQSLDKSLEEAAYDLGETPLSSQGPAPAKKPRDPKVLARDSLPTSSLLVLRAVYPNPQNPKPRALNLAQVLVPSPRR